MAPGGRRRSLKRARVCASHVTTHNGDSYQRTIYIQLATNVLRAGVASRRVASRSSLSAPYTRTDGTATTDGRTGGRGTGQLSPAPGHLPGMAWVICSSHHRNLRRRVTKTVAYAALYVFCDDRLVSWRPLLPSSPCSDVAIPPDWLSAAAAD